MNKLKKRMKTKSKALLIKKEAKLNRIASKLRRRRSLNRKIMVVVVISKGKRLKDRRRSRLVKASSKNSDSYLRVF